MNEDITISNTRTLVPLNKGMPNFQAEFMVRSQDAAPFRAAVVNQIMLDEIPENGYLDMKQVSNGVFSGTLVKNEGQDDTWYIAMEADKETTVSVQVNLGEPAIDPVAAADAEPSDDEPSKPSGLSWWVIALIVLALGCLAYFLWHKFFAPQDFAPSSRSPMLDTPSSDALAVDSAPPLDLDFSELPAV